MASQTSIVAKQIRLMEWAEQIRDCQNRPREMDVAAWCTQHGITKANYYYRLKRVRKACLDLLPDTEDSAFIEVPVPRRKSFEDVTLLSNPRCSTATPVPVSGMQADSWRLRPGTRLQKSGSRRISRSLCRMLKIKKCKSHQKTAEASLLWTYPHAYDPTRTAWRYTGRYMWMVYSASG